MAKLIDVEKWHFDDEICAALFRYYLLNCENVSHTYKSKKS